MQYPECRNDAMVNENLDSDLEEELERGRISEGRILDLDTGPATQAIQLAKRGLEVTGRP